MKIVLQDINDDILFKILKQEKDININQLIKYLNINIGTYKRWLKNEKIPFMYFNQINSFVNNKFELISNEKMIFKLNDMFYTKESEARNLISETTNFISENWKINLDEYNFIEPSAGNGSFYNNFPKNVKKIGMDLTPSNKNIIEKNYFDFIPNKGKNIVIGNPPFGLRGNLALNFINHSAKFADFICFILPPIFNSNGKGSPMLRIDKNFYLAKEIKTKSDFYYPNGEVIKVNSIFQIWTKVFTKKIKPILPPEKKSEWIKVYSLSNGNSSSSRRNVKMINNCDFYLPSTTFKKIRISKTFKELPHNRGYGIVILKEKNKIMKIMNEINWENISFKSTNSANNLRTQLIMNIINSEMANNDNKY